MYSPSYLRSFLIISVCVAACVVVRVSVVCEQIDELEEESILDLLPSKRVHLDSLWDLVELTDDRMDELDEGFEGEVGP